MKLFIFDLGMVIPTITTVVVPLAIILYAMRKKLMWKPLLTVGLTFATIGSLVPYIVLYAPQLKQLLIPSNTLMYSLVIAGYASLALYLTDKWDKTFAANKNIYYWLIASVIALEYLHDKIPLIKDLTLASVL